MGYSDTEFTSFLGKQHTTADIDKLKSRRGEQIIRIAAIFNHVLFFIMKCGLTPSCDLLLQYANN